MIYGAEIMQILIPADETRIGSFGEK